VTTPPYAPISTGSNLSPITFELRDPSTGLKVVLTGATVTVRVTDERTAEVIVAAGSGTVDTGNTSLVSYAFLDAEVAKIAYETTWLVEWKIVDTGGKVFRSPEPIRLPVRRNL
jgi:hypothetical protein